MNWTMRMDAFRFVAVDAGKNSDADRRVAAARAHKKIARQFVALAVHFKSRVVIGDEIGEVRGDAFQRREQVGDGAALFARRLQ